jgi:hypothetical protein
VQVKTLIVRIEGTEGQPDSAEVGRSTKLTNRNDGGLPLHHSRRVVLSRETDGTEHEVELPLTSNIDIPQIAREVGVPDYVDTGHFPMQNAILAIWASERAQELHNLYPEVFGKPLATTSICVLLLGGASVKMHCEHSNANGPLCRRINDVDFAVAKKEGPDFYRLLLNTDKAFGTRFKSFRTTGDRTFNTLNEGGRYRIRAINGMTETGLPTVGVSDIFCDYIDLRHRIDLKDSFEKAAANLHTIGLENILLSKNQFITDVPRTDTDALNKNGQIFRVLPYKHYRADRIILGMEEKDGKDICALFLDHEIGEEEDEISASRMARAIGKDKKLALTVTLNLSNLVDRVEKLQEWLNDAELSTVITRLNELLTYLPKIEKKWDTPWWNVDVETPSTE